MPSNLSVAFLEEVLMTWEDVLARDDIVGGDIETQEGNCVYRGPISAIRMEGGSGHM